MAAVKKRTRVPMTEETKAAYVELLANGVAKLDAARRLGHANSTFFREARKDPEFRAAVDEAWYEGAEPLIDEARRRGQEGWEEPVFGKGESGAVEQVGVIRKYDSNLLMFSIKGRRPEYKENPRIDISSLTQVKFEDRSASVAEMWRVLADAGVNAKTILESRDGGGSVVGQLPAAQRTVAEPSDLQPETGRVPRTPEP